ncbi:MAG: flagellin [Dethiobacter sp.]|nr:flagellin [Dethiobacter sp.]
MRINTNISAMNAHRQLGIANTRGASSMERLSSGLRINRAGDDAAGLSISEKMRAQVRGLNQGARNAQDGISLIQTAESALNETHDILQRVRELAAQSASGTNTPEDRAAMQGEVAQLKSEIDRIGNTTEFNTKTLLNGSLQAAGAAVGQDTTTGAIVGRQAAAVLTGTGPMAGTGVVAGDFTAETLTVDGVSITVNWQNLTTAERDTIQVGTAVGASAGQMNAAKDLIVSTLNRAINESGQNVAPISGHVDSMDPDGAGPLAPPNNLVLTSGSEGVNSAIRTAATTQVLGKVMGVAGTTGATGTSVYNGLTVAGGTSFFANIGDIQFNVTTPALSPITGGTTPMSDAAATLQGSINTAIAAYNTSAGATAGTPGFIENVRVNALADGRFEVISESGPISFSDRLGGSAVRDLGLTQAQSEAAGSGGMTLQIGANRGQSMTFGIKDMRTAALGIANVDVSSQAGASNSISSLDGAIRSVSEQRSSLGAAQNRLEHTIRNLDTSKENLQASEARIRDVDMAAEMMEFTKNNILQQAATAMLAQANMAPQAVLQLLG